MKPENAKILYIDDDHEMRLVVTNALNDICHVIVASTGEEGIAMAVRHKPSLALVDIMMPGLSGYDVVMKLRRLEPLRNIPIVAVTGDESPEKERRARELGFDEYVKKPVNLSQFRALVRGYLSGEISAVEKEPFNQTIHDYSVSLIDRLQQTIEELRGEKIFSESIIQSLASGLMILDLDGRVITINPEGTKIFSVFSEQIGGKKLSEVIGSDKAAAFSEIKENELFSRNEISLTTREGRERIIGFTTAPRTNAGGAMVGTIVSFRDITDIKYIQKEMEKMNRLSTVAEIASAVAHEIRNPLAGIKTMVQSVDENLGADDENKEYVRRIIKQVDRLNEILKGFFSYARPARPMFVRMSVGAILNEVKPLVANRLIEKRITFLHHFDKNLPDILADPNQIQQVFLNLILNAVDAVASDAEIRIIATSVQPAEREAYSHIFPGLKRKQNFIKVEFSDNGCGMSADIVEKIFEPFFTTKHSGSGLGLSIVYRILKENNAAIFVDSAEGRGTKFTMFFQTA